MTDSTSINDKLKTAFAGSDILEPIKERENFLRRKDAMLKTLGILTNLADITNDIVVKNNEDSIICLKKDPMTDIELMKFHIINTKTTATTISGPDKKISTASKDDVELFRATINAFTNVVKQHFPAKYNNYLAEMDRVFGDKKTTQPKHSL